MSKTVKKIIDIKTLGQDTYDSIMETITTSIKDDELTIKMLDTSELVVFNILVTAAEVRREYVLGNVPAAFTSEYDLHKTKSTNAEVSIRGFKIEKLVVIDEYYS